MADLNPYGCMSIVYIFIIYTECIFASTYEYGILVDKMYGILVDKAHLKT